MVERDAALRHVILRGREAIDYARTHGLRLNQSVADDPPAPESSISIEEAERRLADAPESVWLEIRTGVTSAD